MKDTLVYGVLAKTPEATYGTPLSLVAGTDGALLSEESILQADYVSSGERGRAPGTSGMIKRTAPSGRWGNLPIKIEPRGLGSAYGASAFPPDTHHFLRMSGHSATFSATPTPQITYAPISSGWASGTIEAYGRGEKAPMAGCYADCGFMLGGPGIPTFEFDVLGIASPVETDLATPAITYNTVTVPPVALSVALVIGNYTASRVNTITFKKGVERQLRNNINAASGISGYAMGYRTPTLDIELEAEDLTTSSPWTGAATLNGYMLRDSGQTVNITCTVGSVQYNRWKFTAPQAICVKAEKGNNGPVATWKLSFILCVSTGGVDDDYTFLFN